MAKQRKAVYTGMLAKRCAPAVPRPSTSNTLSGPIEMPITDDVFEKSFGAILAHKLKGVSLLRKHYKIPDSDETVAWLTKLVFHLADDHVPYFQEPSGRRRGRRIDRLGYFRLEQALAAEKKAADRGDLSALKRLARGFDEDKLRKRLQRARKDWIVQGLIKITREDPHSREEIERLLGG